MKRQRDVLAIALRNLRVGDELSCTPRSYEGIEQRLQAYRIVNSERRFAIQRSNSTYTIKRIR